MIRLPKIIMIFFVMLLLSFTLAAQQFHFKSPLATVDTTGFYIINVSPEISAYIKPDFSDIRIADDKRQWIPHILKTKWESKNDPSELKLTIINNTITDSGYNYLAVENTTGTTINNLGLYLKNAAVNRTALLSGSNNQRDWYIIDDNILINRSYELARDEYRQELMFPPTAYHFIKLVINNQHLDPLYILRATSNPAYTNVLFNNYIDNPAPSFIKTDSSKKSYLIVSQSKKYHVDKILLDIKGPAFYHREGEISVINSGRNKQHFNTASSYHFVLNAGTMPAIILPKTKADSFLIVIDNGDNPPLKISAIHTQQKQVALISYLEKGKKYELRFSDPDAIFPNYDLQSFQDSIRQLQSLATGEITPISTSVNPVTPVRKNYWLWPVILLALAVLSFLSFRLVSDINKQKNK
ncbi:hypothetical protein BH11BAC3_BH11BAC3_00060 [soil metagenome]